MFNLKNTDNSDALFMHPDLTEKDKNTALKIFAANKMEFEKTRKKNSPLSTLEDRDFIQNVDWAIKAVLQHEINKRTK